MSKHFQDGQGDFNYFSSYNFIFIIPKDFYHMLFVGQYTILYILIMFSKAYSRVRNN